LEIETQVVLVFLLHKSKTMSVKQSDVFVVLAYEGQKALARGMSSQSMPVANSLHVMLTSPEHASGAAVGCAEMMLDVGAAVVVTFEGGGIKLGIATGVMVGLAVALVTFVGAKVGAATGFIVEGLGGTIGDAVMICVVGALVGSGGVKGQSNSTGIAGQLQSHGAPVKQQRGTPLGAASQGPWFVVTSGFAVSPPFPRPGDVLPVYRLGLKPPFWCRY
jgi:hypothetical protein